MRRLPFVLVLASIAPAVAEPLGAHRQYIVTTDARFDYQRDVLRTGDGDTAARTVYSFRLAGDYALAYHITAGGFAGFDGEITDEGSAKSFAIGARAGYALPLGAYATWWPRVGVSFANTSSVAEGRASVTVGAVRLNASAPFVFQPYPRALVGIGPTYDRDLTANSGPDQVVPKTWGLGVHLLFGLWFD